jgi:hypothetical protein
MYKTTESLNATKSFTGDAIVTTTYGDNYVVLDKALSIRDSVAVGDNETAYFLIDPSTYPDDEIFCLPIRMTSTSGRFDVVITPDFTYTTATNAVDVFRRNGVVVDNTGYVKVYKTITGLTINSSPLKYPVGGESSNQNSAGGNVAGESVFTIHSDNKLLISATNNSGEDAYFGIQIDWYEI